LVEGFSFFLHVNVLNSSTFCLFSLKSFFEKISKTA